MNILKQSQIIVIRAMPKNCDKDGRHMFIHSEKGNEHLRICNSNFFYERVIQHCLQRSDKTTFVRIESPGHS